MTVQTEQNNKTTVTGLLQYINAVRVRVIVLCIAKKVEASSHATYRILLAPHGQGRLQICQKLGRIQHNARTQSTSAKPQAIPCQRPTRVDRVG